MFTNMEPYSTDVDEDAGSNRDVFNEKPVKEDVLTAIEVSFKTFLFEPIPMF